MKKNSVLKIVNLLLVVDFLIIAGTAIFHGLIVSTGFYRTFHAYPGFLFIFLVVMHIILNWKWIKNNYLKMR